ncbi:MAG: hypothetical protein CSB24_02735 [Deltaproteobacteria bacterium]|nr:MAG: hypothetical protein CSB24_02735 [Deltaproteobacteria bacterium]
MNYPNEKQPATWLKITITAAPELAGAISDYMTGVLAAGVEINLEGERRVINGFLGQKNLPDKEIESIRLSLKKHLTQLAGIFGLPEPELHMGKFTHKDWSNNWKQHFAPFQVIPGLTIAPTWENYQANGKESVIIMDPGMAFGTGQHPTTARSISLIQKSLAELKGAEMLDVGTGTGILGMAALLLGAERVLGIDNDSDAAVAALANIRLNGLGKAMQVSRQDITELTGEYDLVAANIVHNTLLEMKTELIRLVKPGGQMVLSGLLAGEQAKNIVHTFVQGGMQFIEEETEGEWAALRFGKNP